MTPSGKVQKVKLREVTRRHYEQANGKGEAA